MRLFCFTTAALFAASLAIAEQPATTGPSEDSVRSTYVLGPDDQITIRVPDADEISDKPVRIDMSGYVRLPMVGRIKAGGRTAPQVEALIAERLKQFLNDPDVSVSVTEFRSQPVSVIGSVKNPGVHQLQGRRTLIEILSLAGGLAEDAGHDIKITRRLAQGRIPLKSAQDDPTGEFSVAQVSTAAIMDASNPQDNIVIRPNDVISIPRADMIYVVGDVMHAGGFVLKERETLSVLQAISLAGGLDRGAAPQSARILRIVQGAPSRNEIPVDLKQILTGRAVDMPLHSDDILFVPSSAPKKAAIRALEAAIQVGTGVAIYRR